MKMKNGFTLFEVMIVIAICGLLAAIAIPSFYRAKQIKELQEVGYSEVEAKEITGTNTPEYVRDCIKRGKNTKSPSQFFSTDEFGNPSRSTPNEFSTDGNKIGLPAGASSPVEMGKWYSFTWASSKWIALSDGGTNIVKLFIVDGNKLVPMPSL